MLKASRARAVAHALISLGALVVVSCDRPTTPTVAQPAPLTPRSLPSAQQLSWLRERVRDVARNPRLYPRDTLTVERNGQTERYLATVVEREFRPPASLAYGKPLVRRLLVVWSEDLQHAFIVSSNDSVAQVAPARFPRPWERVGRIEEIGDDSRQSWVGTAGEIRLRIGAATGSCVTTDTLPHDKMGVRDYIETFSDYQDCVGYRYRVSLSVELAKKQEDQASSALSRWLNRPESIRIPEQELPGIRLVEQCGEGSWVGDNCYAFNFWRSQSQFASAFGNHFPFELARLKAIDTIAIYGNYLQTVIPGNGDPTIYCCSNYPGPIEYTIYRLDGGVVRHAKFASALQDTLSKNAVGLTRLRYGSRTLFYVGGLERRNSPVIVDLTLLPCPGAPDATTAKMSVLPPTQGCLPP